MFNRTSSIVSFAILSLFLVIVIGFVFWTQLHAAPTVASIPTRASTIAPSSTLCFSVFTVCQTNSPAAVDIDRNDIVDLIITTQDGMIVRIENDAVQWRFDTAPIFGRTPGSQAIHSAPAIADIDNNGTLDIIVTTGGTRPSFCQPGGIVVLSADGTVQTGWPQLTDDHRTLPSGCSDTIYGSPAVGDLDNDGTLEIIAGGFDGGIYVWEHTGERRANFPIASAHFETLNWPDLQNHLGDTIISSPALADIDGDTFLDIVIGTDEGNFEFLGDWECAYALPSGWSPNYCGGSLYVVNRHGEILDGYPRYIYETMQSSPATIDLESDGKPEIIVGTGNFYHRFSPDQPTGEFKLYIWGQDGAPRSGWENGMTTDSPISGAPAVGDVTGNFQKDIAAVSDRGMLYVWHKNGASVDGFPIDLNAEADNEANTDWGDVFLIDAVRGGGMELVVSSQTHVSIYDRSGERRLYYAMDSIASADPIAADFNRDGTIDLLMASETIAMLELDGAGNAAAWPMFRKNPARSGGFPLPQHLPNKQYLPLLSTAP